MKADAKQDLTIRLEGLISELAAASDRRRGLEALHVLLEAIPVSEDAGDPDAALIEELRAVRLELADARDEFDHQGGKLKTAGEEIDALRTQVESLTTEKTAAVEQLEASQADVTRLTAEVDAARTAAAQASTDLEASKAEVTKLHEELEAATAPK